MECTLDPYRPRFSFEITEEQKKRADILLGAYGMRKLVFGIILDDVLDLIEEHGPYAVGILMSGNLKPREIIKPMKEVTNHGHK